MPEVIDFHGIDVYKHGNGTIEFRRGTSMIVIPFTQRDEFLDLMASLKPKSRFRDFTDDEIVVMDCAVHEDEGSWHDEEKEEVRVSLASELEGEVESREIIPNE